jgi:hypothetical protein
MTAEKWGKDLGILASITHCIHSVSKNERAVIILDQLDAYVGLWHILGMLY